MYKRKLKTVKDGDILFVPQPVGLGVRIQALLLGVECLFVQELSHQMKLESLKGGILMFLLGYRYREYDLTKDEHYQMMKFVEWIETLDEDIQQAVLAEYRGKLDEDR